jgi:hypothetical protein
MGVTLVSRPGSWLLDVPLSKYELLVRIDDAFAAIARELGGGRGRAGEPPSRGGGWSITDHLSHLAGWEALELARVEGRSGAPEVVALQVDALRRKVGRPGERRAAWGRLEEAHRRLMRAVWDLPESALRRPWHPARSFTLAAELATNTVEHYNEHVKKSRRLG